MHTDVTVVGTKQMNKAYNFAKVNIHLLWLRQKNSSLGSYHTLQAQNKMPQIKNSCFISWRKQIITMALHLTTNISVYE